MVRMILLFLALVIFSLKSFSQSKVIHKDSIIYHITYRDTVIYRYDTMHVKHYVHSDTIQHRSDHEGELIDQPRKKHLINQNNWGIGPSVGAYYSPFNGFDVNIGFGIQYYLLAVPSFRNPHLGHKRNRRVK